MQVISLYNNSHEIYIGTQIGTLKKCTTNSNNKETKNDKTLKEIKNLKDTCDTDIGVAITSMCWLDAQQTEILLSQCNNTVRTYSTITNTSSLTLRVNDKNPIIGAYKNEKIIATCTEAGKLTLWENDAELKEINVGKHVAAFQESPSDKNLLITGGKENITKIWDLNTAACIFSAKNEPHDALQMEVPIWVSDSTFMYEDNSLVASASRYGKVHLYDQRAQRRPVIVVDVGNALTSISCCNYQRSVVVGTTTGTMKLIDLRDQGKALNTYKDFAGSVTKIVCDKNNPFIISVSLDRYLRVHHRNTKKVVYKVYIKTKPSCLLLKNCSLEAGLSKEDLEEGNHSDSDSDDCLSGLPTIQ